MIHNSFVHDDVFRSNVLQFVNDNETHPVVKYKGFIIAFLLVIAGIIILLLFNHDKLLNHSFWKHLFVPVSELRNKYVSLNKRGGGGGGGAHNNDNDDNDNDDDDVIFGYDYKYRNSEAAIFREAIEGMTTKDGKATTKSGEFVSADTESAEKKKKTPCATDCSQYIELKGKINDLSKYVNAVKDQTAEIKQTSDKLQELGKQIEDLNNSLSPGGQVNITL